MRVGSWLEKPLVAIHEQPVLLFREVGGKKSHVGAGAGREIDRVHAARRDAGHRQVRQRHRPGDGVRRFAQRKPLGTELAHLTPASVAAI